MGWALFAYLPILVGYNAAREFGGLLRWAASPA